MLNDCIGKVNAICKSSLSIHSANLKKTAIKLFSLTLPAQGDTCQIRGQKFTRFFRNGFLRYGSLLGSEHQENWPVAYQLLIDRQADTKELVNRLLACVKRFTIKSNLI